MSDLEKIIFEVEKASAAASSLHELDGVRVAALGKKGSVTLYVKEVGKLPAEERAKAGKAANEAKQKATKLINDRKQVLIQAQLDERLSADRVDVTLPGRGHEPGGLHPVTRIIERIRILFERQGFRIEDGPEIEDEFHNFDALNFKPDHPARADMDTFYLEGSRLLLRTHTSPVQIRSMLKRGAPIRVIAIGRTYRCDSDLTHTPMFHQVEGLLVDEGVSMAHLRGILETFLQQIFEDEELTLRFRPSFFPFVEPGAEVDVSCLFCHGNGCRICKQSGWMEILGCGMVHPNVLRACDIDPEKFTGWAFGLGIERLGMLRYGINDIRMNFENDLRFLQQFN